MTGRIPRTDRQLKMTISMQRQLELLDQYKKSQGTFSNFTATLSVLITTLLGSSGIQVHTVTHRFKSYESLAGKLSRPDKTYDLLTEITDLAGIRITTYFAGDVDRIAKVLEREFQVDPNASVDKRKYIEPERFGYSSLHYVVELSAARTNLSEYSKYQGLKCEIQVRSILQHAWAEIEHDLGYKSAAGVPIDIRRRFARVASLLELADDEFSHIRVALKEYEATVAAKISQSPTDVSLDLASFRALYEIDSHVERLDQLVLSIGNGRIGSQDDLRADTLVERLHSFGVANIGQLEHIAQREVEAVSAFVALWVEEELGPVSRGIGIFYLLYVLAASTKSKTSIEEYLTKFNIGTDEDRPMLIDKILEFGLSQSGAD